MMKLKRRTKMRLNMKLSIITMVTTITVITNMVTMAIIMAITTAIITDTIMVAMTIKSTMKPLLMKVSTEEDTEEAVEAVPSEIKSVHLSPTCSTEESSRLRPSKILHPSKPTGLETSVRRDPSGPSKELSLSTSPRNQSSLRLARLLSSLSKSLTRPNGRGSQAALSPLAPSRAPLCLASLSATLLLIVTSRECKHSS